MIPKVLQLSNILLMFSSRKDSMGRATRRLAVFGLLAATVCAGGMGYAGAARAEGSAIAGPALLPAAAQAKTQPLFIIERSKNANVVHYDARLDADGRLDPKEPVVAYWIMLAEDGRRENLNWIEKRKAYGFDQAGPLGQWLYDDPGVRPRSADHREEGGPGRPRRTGYRGPAGRSRENVHQFLRRADGAQGPLHRAAWKRHPDREGALRKDLGELAGLQI